MFLWVWVMLYVYEPLMLTIIFIFFLWWQSFQLSTAITPVTWSFWNHDDLVLKKQFLLSVFKTVCCLMFFYNALMDIKLKKTGFILNRFFCNNAKVFILTNLMLLCIYYYLKCITICTVYTVVYIQYSPHTTGIMDQFYNFSSCITPL